jgi:hypothetical protein
MLVSNKDVMKQTWPYHYATSSGTKKQQALVFGIQSMMNKEMRGMVYTRVAKRNNQCLRLCLVPER